MTLKKTPTAFDLMESVCLPGLDACLLRFHDPVTGLTHLHIERDDPERVFLLGVPTRPTSDNGVAHVLEHLALCANHRFPVRDPFFGMRQRSLASYMNAATGAEATVYPFATPDIHDFWNLMDVYVHAVFYPMLDRPDFLQEAWRPIPDASGKIRLDGVVLNEMRGALANQAALYHMALQPLLEEGTSRAHYHGGRPDAIVSLTLEDVREFHSKFYHPSRAVVATTGQVEPTQVQRRLRQWLSRTAWTPLSPLPPEVAKPHGRRRVQVPLLVTHADQHNEHRINLVWPLALPSADDRLLALAISALLVDDGAPVGVAIEQAGFGRPGIIGCAAENTTPAFHLGMDGLTAEQVGQAEAWILSVLCDLQGRVFDPDVIEGVLDSIEFGQMQREGFGGTPYGVDLVQAAAFHYLRGKDPADALDRLPALARVRARLAEPGAVWDWVKHHLLDNPNRLTIEGRPDTQVLVRMERALTQAADAIQASLTPKALEQAMNDERQLVQRQEQPSRHECLPFIRPDQIGPHVLALPPVQAWPSSSASMSTVCAPQGAVPSTSGVRVVLLPVPTPGLLRTGISMDLSDLPVDRQPWADLAMDMIMALGTRSMRWDQLARRLTRVAALRDSELRPVDRAFMPRPLSGMLSPGLADLEGRIDLGGLRRQGPALLDLLEMVLNQVSASDTDRVGQLIRVGHDQIRQNALRHGNKWARLASQAHLGGGLAMKHRLNGLPMIYWIRDLRLSMDSRSDGVDWVASQIDEMFGRLRRAPVVVRIEGAAGEVGPLVDCALDRFAAHAPWESLRAGHRSSSTPAHIPHGVLPPIGLALTMGASVNHVWQTYRGPDRQDDLAPAAMVATRLMTAIVLHPAIRERGGAYGGGAIAQPGQISFYSYRDPRFGATLDDFNQSIARIGAGEFSAQQMEEAILSALRDSQAPRTPADQADVAWSAARIGVTTADRQAFLDRARAVRKADVKAVIEQWLTDPSQAGTSAVIAHDRRHEAEARGLYCHEVDLDQTTPLPAVA